MKLLLKLFSIIAVFLVLDFIFIINIKAYRSYRFLNLDRRNSCGSLNDQEKIEYQIYLKNGQNNN